MNWAFWAELWVRSAIVLIATLALGQSALRASAAFRYRLFLAGVVAVTALPLLAVVLPVLPIALWPAASSSGGSVSVVEISSAALRRTATAHTINWPVLIWLAGVVVSLAPLLPAGLSARRMIKRAKPVQDGDWSALLDDLCARRRASRKPELLISEEMLSPLTCGVFHPHIVLPADACHWNHLRRRLVLLHEMAHVRRRDVAAQVCVHFMCALWWFQPLSWLVRRKMRRESELACDAEALASGVLPSIYAEELLALAKGLNSNYRWSSAAISMARTDDLQARFACILRSRRPVPSQLQIWTAGLTLTTVAVGASTVTPKFERDLSEQGGSTMKRTLLSALLTSAGLSAATVSGSISDPSGAAIPDAKVLVLNPDTGTKQEAATGADGKFSLSDTPAGEYILRVEKPGFASILQEFNLQEDSKINREFTMNVGRVNEEVHVEAKGSPAESSSPGAPKRVRIGGQVAQANLIFKKQPVYPAAAKAAGVQGTVELETVISREGVPLEIRVVRSPSDDLSESSLEAVRQWRYRPTLLNGNPIEIVTDVIVNYTLAP